MERVKYYSKNDLGNGLQLLQTEKVLRNKYSHGAMSCLDSEEEHKKRILLFFDDICYHSFKDE